MNVRGTVWTLMVCAFWALGVAGPHAQARRAEMPRTASGATDLQGVWDFRSLTPMERPGDLAENEVFTDEQAAEFSVLAPFAVGGARLRRYSATGYGPTWPWDPSCVVSSFPCNGIRHITNIAPHIGEHIVVRT